MKLRTGVIGCGKVTPLHAKALAASQLSDFRAVCSRSRARAGKFAEMYGAQGYDNVEEMIAKEALDAVVVCTPHPFHAWPAIQAAKSGAHVLVEKPLALDGEEADR